MTNLQKIETVLEVTLTAIDDGLDDQFVYYDDLDEDNKDRFTSLQMSRRDYEDFGRPTIVTVTIVPGDTLNEKTSNPS